MSTPSTISVETPQTRCRAAVGRCDITPPIGIYHRMWGAATHERATDVHRPLQATMLWLEPESGGAGQSLIVVGLDHCILDAPDIAVMQRAVADAASVRPEQVVILLAHTHAAGLMSRSRSELPGGEFIGPYLDDVANKLGEQAAVAAASRRSASIVYGKGRCGLAAHRDFLDPQSGQIVCGLNPDGPADDTVLVARICAADESLMGTVVNYACHPTTLAWQNTLISPDYVGSLREIVERQTGAPCMFLQGASADLGPRDGFVGDTAVADRNGRQLAFAALSALEGLPRGGTAFEYAGPVVSGATIGTWRHAPLGPAALGASAAWRMAGWNTPLDYRQDLPSLAEAHAELARWQGEEAKATLAGHAERERDCHARAEQAARQIWRLEALPAGRFPLPIRVARMGGGIWVFVTGEHYQSLQTALRERFPQFAIIVATIAGGWQPGYVPPAEEYGRGIYQERIAVVAAGSAERVLETIDEQIRRLVA